MRASSLKVVSACVLGAGFLLPSLGASTGHGCGLDWKQPTNHFDGVNEQGYVSYWETIGEADCGDGLKLPLFINFNSKHDVGAPSPYLGQGWLLPLLESKFVQESEDRFYMVQPDGLNNLFLRAEANGTVLNGSAGWKGEIKGETITAWADCGWKLVYDNGHIASMTTPKGRKLDWVYEGGRVSELREGNATRLKVEYDSEGHATALTLPGGKRILIALEKKPRVQSIGGQNVVAGVDNSLGGLTLADGEKRSFTFGPDEKMLPTLKVADGLAEEKGGMNQGPGRLLGWNPQTKLAVRDGDWTYQITPAQGVGSNAAIGRSNAQGQKEYWLYDRDKGEEVTEGANGVKTVKSWFTSGVLAGATRKIEETSKGACRIAYRAAYDDKGRMIRETSEDGVTTQYTYNEKDELIRETPSNGVATEYKYDEHGNQTAAISGGKTLWSKVFDGQGRIKEEFDLHGEHTITNYLSDGSVSKTVSIDGGPPFVRTLRDGLEVQRKMADGGTIRYEYDSNGVLVKTVDAQNTIWGYKYGQSGDVIETYENGILVYKIFTDSTKTARLRVSYKQDGSMTEAWDWIHNKTYSQASQQIQRSAWIPL